LLQRFYNPQEGKIRVDDYQIEHFDLNWWRGQMALVAQEPALFTTTIKENIRLGRLNATDEEIIEAAKNANAHGFIMSTPLAYDTHVGEGGTQLSGGQKQRIAIGKKIFLNNNMKLVFNKEYRFTVHIF
jgi:ABC-type multidrug transport system fused ATPase/permease subunit